MLFVSACLYLFVCLFVCFCLFVCLFYVHESRCLFVHNALLHSPVGNSVHQPLAKVVWALQVRVRGGRGVCAVVEECDAIRARLDNDVSRRCLRHRVRKCAMVAVVVEWGGGDHSDENNPIARSAQACGGGAHEVDNRRGVRTVGGPGMARSSPLLAASMVLRVPS
jgi:hypothetical protein